MEQVKCYGMLEISLPRTGQETGVIPEAVFTLNGESVSVRGFSENENLGRVRFMPMKEGTWQYEMKWGTEKKIGSFACVAAASHGPVRTEVCHFCYDDGTRYIPVGTRAAGSMGRQRKECAS